MNYKELQYLKNKILKHTEEYLGDYQYKKGLVDDLDYIFEEYGKDLTIK